MSTYQWALLFHLTGAFLFVSGMAVAGAAFESARRRRRPADIALLLGMSRIGVGLVALGGLLILVFGMWLVDQRAEGLREAWVGISLALFVVAAVLGAIGGQRPKRARLLAAALTTEGRPEETPELRKLLDDRIALGVNYLSALLVALIVLLMVWQPH